MAVTQRTLDCAQEERRKGSAGKIKDRMHPLVERVHYIAGEAVVLHTGLLVGELMCYAHEASGISALHWRVKLHSWEERVRSSRIHHQIRWETVLLQQQQWVSSSLISTV
jgi:hypothetical protein